MLCLAMRCGAVQCFLSTMIKPIFALVFVTKLRRAVTQTPSFDVIEETFSPRLFITDVLHEPFEALNRYNGVTEP